MRIERVTQELADGMSAVTDALPESMSRVAVIVWFLTPKSLMNGRTPMEALAEGDLNAALAEARAYGVS